MFDSSQPTTFPAIHELCSLAKESSKPLVFWIGGGASAWTGMPLWSQLADIFHKEFGRKETAYNRTQANKLLESGDLPAFFSFCKRVSSARYFTLMHEHLRLPDPVSPIYNRFIAALRNIPSIMVVTTNVDELLEHNLAVQSLLASNLSIVPDLISRRENFVAKLHGSISDVQSLVFTTEDYDAVVHNASYLDALKRIFQDASVVFVGYGLRDNYILEAIKKTSDLAAVFGIGPHFACLSHDAPNLPPSVKNIRYISEPHRDHRSAIQLVEEIGLNTKAAKTGHSAKLSDMTRGLTSAHMLSDVYPAGTWRTSQRVVANRNDGKDEIVFYHGHGFTQNELPFTLSTAMHDLAVGLLCFDRVYAPLSALGRLHDLLSGERFTDLVRADVIRLIRLRRSEAAIFPTSASQLVGYLGTVTMPESGADGRELTVFELICKQLKPVPGHETQAEQLFRLLENKVLDPTPQDLTALPSMVHSLLLRPSVRTMLGIGGGTSITTIPRWVMFPILRLAHVVRLGVVCRELQLASIKFDFGNDKLAGPAFSGAFGEESAERLASYIVAGNFGTDLGAYINQHPEIIHAILRFRDTAEGQRLRAAVLESLAVSQGGEVSASINAGLKRIVPLKILEDARTNFARLCLASENQNLPAVWHDADYGDKALKLWKQRSASEFESICREQKCSPYAPCPCGSGEKMKFCCGEALSVKF